MMSQNFEHISSLVQFDDDLLTYGGDIELTEDEEVVKKKMQKLKEDFDGEDTPERQEALLKKREKMAIELDKRLVELKISKQRNYLILGTMVLIMAVLSLIMCKKSGGEKLDKEVLKEKQELDSERQKLVNLKLKL